MFCTIFLFSHLRVTYAEVRAWTVARLWPDDSRAGELEVGHIQVGTLKLGHSVARYCHS